MLNYGVDRWNRGDRKVRPIIINMDEMSDSREVYESKPGRVGIIFLYTILTLCIAVIVWMIFGKIDEVVKSQGIVRPNGDISTVVNQIEGEIIKVNVKDGEYVKKGDCLYQIDCSTQETQKEYLEKQLEELSQKIHCMEVYQRSVKADKNLLSDSNSDMEEKYYIQFESYFINYKNAIHNKKFEKQINKYKVQSNEKQLLKKRSLLSLNRKLKKSIEKGKNLFSNYGDESQYYNLYEQYVNGYEKIMDQYQLKEQEITVSTESTGLVNTITYYNEKKEGLETLIKSIQSQKNCFLKKSSYQLTYEEYENKMDQLNEEYQLALEEYNLNFELQEYGISAAELEKSEQMMYSAKKAISDYKTSFLAETNQQLFEVKKNLSDSKNQKKGQLSKNILLKNNNKQKRNALNAYIAEYKTSLDSRISELEDGIIDVEDNIESLKLEEEKEYEYSDNEDSSVSSIKINELKTNLESISTCYSQMDELKSQLETIQFQIDHATVGAAIDGTVNSKVLLVRGDVLLSGTEVMTIIPDTYSDYKVNIYVANQNIGKLKNGMKVKLSLDAFPSSEYGYLTGTITSISNDIKVDSKNANGYYLIEAKIENEKLFDKNGQELELKSGMTGQVNIIVQEKSIFQYIMEKLNLWVNS